MAPEAPTNYEPAKGLPTVAPPSGKFIVQLFLVPGLIVTFAMVLVWGFGWLVGGSYTAEQFLKGLRDPNPEVRWRRASDLSQVLPGDKTLAANPTFGLALAALLQEALVNNEQDEQAWARRLNYDNKQTPSRPDKALDDERRFILFLIPCLGRLTFPIGVPLLEEIALKDDVKGDPDNVKLRRQQAVLALATLPENLKYLDKISEQEAKTIFETLENEATNSPQGRGKWAEVALDYIQSRRVGKLECLGVDKTLAECANPKNPISKDPMLREKVAFALNFWQGNQQENQRMEETLLLLSHDDGHGAESAEVRERGLRIRYKATEALARRGSEKIKNRLAILREMLDEDKQRENFRTELQGGREVPDENLVYSTVRGALRGITELHHRQPTLDLTSLYPAIEKLSESSIRELRTETQRTQIELNKK
jgi:hypothetical protein